MKTLFKANYRNLEKWALVANTALWAATSEDNHSFSVDKMNSKAKNGTTVGVIIKVVLYFG